MSILIKIREDLKSCIKGNREVANILKLIVGEIERLPTKTPTNNDIIPILIKLVNNETEICKYKKENPNNSLYIQTINNYIPLPLTEDDIIKWITLNVDFSKFKNKIQSISFIKNNIGQPIDGNIIKNIILTHF